MPARFEKIFLDASAGSGKTYQLCLEYIELLFKKCNPSEILTITFTKKAASQMQNRIFSMISTLRHDINSKQAQEILQSLVENGLKKEDILNEIASIHQSFNNENLNISTIDSFFYTMLKKFSFFAGIKSDFEVSQTKEDVLDLFLEKMFKQEDNILLEEEIIDILSLNSLKIKNLNALLENLSDKVIELSSYEALKNKEDLEHLQKSFKQYLSSSKKFLLDMIEQNSLKENKNITSMLKTFSLSLSEYGSKDTIISKGINHAYFKSFKIQDYSLLEENLEALKSILARYEKAMEAKSLQTLLKLIDIYNQAKNESYKQTNKLSFDSIKQKVFTLISDKNSSFSSEYFYFRLDSKIKHILFDEFQDTSSLQYKIFLPLVNEILANKRAVFFVGDDKQSIYRFRGANTEVFLDAKKDSKTRILQDNYRSSKNIVEFNNEKFKDVFLDFPLQNVKKDSSGFVEVSLLEVDSTNLKQEIFKEVTEKILSLLNLGIKKSDINILAFVRADLIELKEYIAQNNICFKDELIDISLDKAGKLLDQKNVRIIINALKKEDNKINELALNSLYNNDIFKEVDLNIKQNLALKFKIKQIIKQLKLFCFEALKFLEYSLLLEYKNLEDFLAQLEEINIESSSFNTINAMTIHASKGLSLEHVIIIDKINKTAPNTSRLFYFYDKLDLKKIYFRHFKTRQFFDEEFNSFIKTQEELEKKELKNIIYVALTRAKSSMQIISYSTLQKSSKTSASLNKKSILAEELNLDNYKQGALQKQENSKEEEDKKIICANIEIKKSKQEDFLLKEDSKYIELSNIFNLYKGNGVHLALELLIAYKIKNTLKYLKSEFGFYLSQNILEQIEHKAQKSFNLESRLKKQFLEYEIITELSFLDENKLLRMDALLKTSSGYIVLELKNSLNPAFTQSYTLQVQNYKNFVNKQLKSKKEAKAFIFYFENSLMLETT